MFVNGTQVASTTNSTSLNSTLGPTIGDLFVTSVGYTFPYTGYMSNIRIVKGAAVYTTNFTPSTTPLQPIAGTVLLTCADNRFIDDSFDNFAITRTGDVRVEKFNPFGIQTAATPVSHSVYFDGTGDYLSLASNTAFGYGTDPFTIECWFNTQVIPPTGGDYLFDQRTTPFQAALLAYITPSAALEVFINGAAITGGTVAINTWNHFAVSKSGTTTRMFLNGVQVGSSLTDNNNYGNLPVVIGSRFSAEDFFTGYISNFRIIKGRALYTANFTPSTAPLTAVTNTSLLTCQNSTFVDNSSNRFAITAVGNTRPLPVNPFGFTAGTKTGYTPAVFGGSMTFDGTGDYLQSPSQFTITTGPFTIELWIYLNAVGTAPTILENAVWSIGQNGGYRVSLTSSNFVRLEASTATFNTFPTVITATSSALTTGQWHHVVLTRDSSNVVRIFVNGISSATPVTYATSLNSASTGGIQGRVGANVSDGTVYGPFNGQLADVRVVPGTALYTSNFVPPTAPLTPVVNTVVLLNGTGAAIYDASMSNNLETAGDARNVTNIVRYGTTSLSFDGTGDYLLASTNPNFSFGTGDFTVEAWVNFSVLAANRVIADCWVSGGAGAWQLYYTNTTGKIVWYVNASAIVSSTTTPLVNTWYHVAVARLGPTVKIFINGVEEGSATHTTNLTHTRPLAVGIQHSTLTNPLNGYISDLRITRGVARYTATFTPPAAPLKTK
jgi:hypothetical protein